MCIDPHQTGFVGKGSDHLQLIKFLAVPRPREGGLRRGEIFWLRLTTASAQCLRLYVSTFFISLCITLSLESIPVSFRQPCMKHSADDVTLSTCSPLSPSITHSLFEFIPGSKLTFSTNLFHRSLLAPAGLPTGLDSFCSTVFSF